MATWISSSNPVETAFAINFEEVLRWAEGIHRWQKPFKMLRVPEQFWTTLSQLRFAYWFDSIGHGVSEFEPVTIDSRRCDFRCRVRGEVLDIEVARPQPSDAQQRNITLPLGRIKDAVFANGVCVNHEVRVWVPSGLSLAHVDESVAELIAEALALSIANDPLDTDQSRKVSIPGLTFAGQDIAGRSPPIEVTLTNTGDATGCFSSGISVMDFQKGNRLFKATGSSEDWLMHLFMSEAEHFDPAHVNGIVIDDTDESALWSRLVSPFPNSFDATLDRFFLTPLGNTVSFVGIAIAAPGLPAPRTGDIWINPNGRGASLPDVMKAIDGPWRAAAGGHPMRVQPE